MANKQRSEQPFNLLETCTIEQIHPSCEQYSTTH